MAETATTSDMDENQVSDRGLDSFPEQDIVNPFDKLPSAGIHPSHLLSSSGHPHHPRLMSSSSSSTTHTNTTGKSLLNHKTSNSSQATSYLQNIPGINMILPANDPSVRTIKQHYYPEGGWGWVIISLSSFVHFLTAAISSPVMSLLILEIINTFSPESGIVAAVLAACLCTSVTLFASPFIIAVCRRKSPRLMAILGGLVTALGCLFTSFATQFHQLFFAFGIFIGVGIAMIREPSVVMVGQYFKKKREAVEVALMSCYSLGISFMPLFITFCIRSKSWRFALQTMAGVVSLCFFLGVLYRPASLYHPQRRAILHLKSLQKRSRLKDQHLKNATQATQLQSSLASGGGTGVERGVTSTSKAAPSSGGQGGAGSASSSEKPAYFDFAVLKSKTVQIILSGTCIAHFGITAPIFLLGIQGQMDGLEYASLMRIQIFVGLGMILGTLVFGFIIVKNSSECFISRQYLCQTCCLILSIIVFAFSSGVTDYSGYVLFSWMYGFFYGGYSYSLKMFIFEKVRARNFNRAWGFLQFSQSLPSFFGIPITIFLNEHFESKGGFYLSSSCLALGSVIFFLIDAHKSSKNRNRVTSSTTTAAVSASAAGIESGIASSLLMKRSRSISPPHSRSEAGNTSHGHVVSPAAVHQMNQLQNGLNKNTTNINSMMLDEHGHHIRHHHHHHHRGIASLSSNSSSSAVNGHEPLTEKTSDGTTSSTQSFSGTKSSSVQKKLLKSFIRSLSMSTSDDIDAQIMNSSSENSQHPEKHRSGSGGDTSTSSGSTPSPKVSGRRIDQQMLSKPHSNGHHNLHHHHHHRHQLLHQSSFGAASNSSGGAAAAELTCISEEVMLENLLDDLIWDTTALDEDFILNGLETNPPPTDQDRLRMLTQFQNNLKGFLGSKKEVSGSGPVTNSGRNTDGMYEIPVSALRLIEEKKKELAKQQEKQKSKQTDSSVMHHHENCPVRLRMGSIASSLEHSSSLSSHYTSGSSSDHNHRVGSNDDNGHVSPSSHSSSIPPPLPSSSPPVSDDVPGMESGEHNSNNSSSSPDQVSVNGDKNKRKEQDNIIKRCPHEPHNKSSVNEGDKKQCLECKTVFLKKSEKKNKKRTLDYDEEDAVQRDSSRTNSSTDDEETEMLKNTRLVSDDDDDSDNEDKRKRLSKKALNNSNDSFPDDDSFVGHDLEVEDEEVCHEKSFEQEDTIVYFHLEQHPHRVVTPTAEVS